VNFSIVTPSYNQGHFIRHTIDSVLSQAGVQVQYLVMDGGSRDDTTAVLRSYGDRFEWVSEKDNGQTHAINKGLKRATGEIVAYLNSDDVYLPGTLAKVAAVFEQHPEVDLVYGDFLAIDAQGGTIDRIKTIPFDANILLYDANFICQPASFYRHSLLSKIGPFDDSLRFLMDYEFFLRAAKRGVGFHLLAEPLACIRFHGDCKTLSNGVYPWGDERRRIIAEYARPKAQHPSALRTLRWLYRAKRYLKLMARGRVDFANIRLARHLRRMV
jgi:glycosyltransferase involved in cell wall biosynthesis